MSKLHIMEKLYGSIMFDIIYLHGYHFITASFVFITNIVSEIIWNICNKDSCKIYNCYYSFPLIPILIVFMAMLTIT